jgi:hypothetical protein
MPNYRKISENSYRRGSLELFSMTSPEFIQQVSRTDMEGQAESAIETKELT